MPPAIADTERILSEAVEIASAAERQAFIERACAGNNELQRQVMELVRNHFLAGAFLEQPAHYDLPTNITPAADAKHVSCAWYFLAMTDQKLGHGTAPREWYDRAEPAASRQVAEGKSESGEPLLWIQKWTLELLRAEAFKSLR